LQSDVPVTGGVAVRCLMGFGRGVAPRVAVLVEDDGTFLLPAVDRTIRILTGSGFRVTHLGIVPPKLGRHRGWRIPLWYFRVLGSRTVALLAAFSVLERWRRLWAHFGTERLSLSWRGLASKFRLDACRFLASPNHLEAIEFLRASRCDILIVMVPYVLGPEVLEVPKVGTINKHAAILPGCRGLFPYLWSTVHGRPLGITFHKVVAQIDAGPVLLRRHVSLDNQPKSMIEFYMWVFREFPEMALEAARRLFNGTQEQNAGGSPGDYFSLPTPADYARFRKAGGRIIRLGDLWRSLAL
jgi:hypothetical protein